MQPDVEFAQQLFNQLAQDTSDGCGITRESYGASEHIAHEIVCQAGRALGLEIQTDFAGNSYMTLPGRDRNAPAIVTGSHLDSVREGGNFDGAAGVVSGLCAAAGMLKAGIQPPQDFIVVAWRAEEGCWFPQTWLGSRMALGRLPASMVDELRHVSTGKSLAHALEAMGLDPEPIRKGQRFLDPAKIRCYIEVHIEQGPILDEAAIPVGIVTAIMGGPRYRDAVIRGHYSHAGGSPRHSRRDSVVAFAEFVKAINDYWESLESRGQDAVFTFGVVHTDPLLNSFSRVSGHVQFCLDARFAEIDELSLFKDWLASLTRSIEQKQGVEIELGTDTGPKILPMDPSLQSSLASITDECQVKTRIMPSGAGHDAGVFIECSIPTAMLFIRNQHGSHSSDEGMELKDFLDATRILMGFIANDSGA